MIKIQQLILLSLTIVSINCASSTQEVVTLAENQLNALKTRAQLLYSKKCESNSLACGNPIFDQCSPYTPELTCETEQPYPSYCKAEGIFQNWETFAGRCETDVPCNTPEDKELQCAMQGIFDESSNVRHERDSPIVNQYVGFYNSFRVIYPYFHAEMEGNKCSLYDPRYRPWYVGAATGAKNVVLIVDKSGSMDNHGRKSSAILAAVSVLETLGQQDWFSIILFSTTAESRQTAMVKATQENIKNAITDMEALQVSGKTNYEEAFKKAFDVIKATTDNEFGSSCETLLLFLTDGQPSDGAGSYDESASQSDKETAYNALKATIESNKPSSGTFRIFSYVLGDQIETVVPSKLACDYNGIFFAIGDANSGAELKTKMRSYFDFLAYGIYTDNPVAIWSEIYDDSTTGLKMVTAAMPIYVENSAQTNLLLAVAGVDILVDTIKGFSDYESVLNTIQSRTRTACTAADLNACQMESLRDSNYQCGVSNCQTFETNYGTCSSTVSADPWKSEHEVQYKSSQLSPCCPSGSSIMMFSLGVLVFVLHLVFGI